MTYGPIDFIALEFPGSEFTGEILRELIDLVERDIIRIIDLVAIRKDGDGAFEVVEMQELDSHVLTVLDPLEAEASGILTVADIEDLAAQLENDTSAALLLIENLWAIRTVEAMERANARLVMYDRIPHQVVVEALEEIAAIESVA
jgi:uncharacterized membrane protein